MIERLSAETKVNFQNWINTDFKNELLFDSIASEIIELFPSKKIFLENKAEIIKFIESSLPHEYQILLAIKFGRNLPQDIKTKKMNKLI
jgi:hypothetical protein